MWLGWRREWCIKNIAESGSYINDFFCSPFATRPNSRGLYNMKFRDDEIQLLQRSPPDNSSKNSDHIAIIMQGFPQSIIASWYHDALNFYPDASVIPMMLFQMP